MASPLDSSLEQFKPYLQRLFYLTITLFVLSLLVSNPAFMITMNVLLGLSAAPLIWDRYKNWQASRNDEEHFQQHTLASLITQVNFGALLVLGLVFNFVPFLQPLAMCMIGISIGGRLNTPNEAPSEEKAIRTLNFKLIQAGIGIAACAAVLTMIGLYTFPLIATLAIATLGAWAGLGEFTYTKAYEKYGKDRPLPVQETQYQEYVEDLDDAAGHQMLPLYTFAREPTPPPSLERPSPVNPPSPRTVFGPPQ